MLFRIRSYGAECYVAHHVGTNFGNQRNRFRLRFFDKQISRQRRHEPIFALGECAQVNTANIFTIMTRSYADSGRDHAASLTETPGGSTQDSRMTSPGRGGMCINICSPR
jgi:hypothetical protein